MKYNSLQIAEIYKHTNSVLAKTISNAGWGEVSKKHQKKLLGTIRHRKLRAKIIKWELDFITKNTGTSLCK